MKSEPPCFLKKIGKRLSMNVDESVDSYKLNELEYINKYPSWGSFKK